MHDPYCAGGGWWGGGGNGGGGILLQVLTVIWFQFYRWHRGVKARVFNWNAYAFLIGFGEDVKLRAELLPCTFKWLIRSGSPRRSVKALGNNASARCCVTAPGCWGKEGCGDEPPASDLESQFLSWFRDSQNCRWPWLTREIHTDQNLSCFDFQYCYSWY